MMMMLSWPTPMLVWEDAPENESYKMKVICLTTVLWCNGNNAIGYACDVHRSLGSILAHALFFLYYIITTTFISFLMESGRNFDRIHLEFDWNVVSIGIPWNLEGNLMDSHGNGSQRLLDSDHFHQNSLEKVGISMEMEAQLAEAPAKCFP